MFKRIWISFLISLGAQLLMPSFSLLFFAPFLVTVAYRRGLYSLVWYGVMCGVCVDMLSSTPHFGVSSLAYVLALTLLYFGRRFFFEDKLSTLPIQTALFSMLVALFTASILLVFSRDICFSLRWVVTDVIEMACVDALYALLFFSLPFQISHMARKMVLYWRRS